MGLVLSIIAIPSVSYADQTAINLGATSTFAVLTGTTSPWYNILMSGVGVAIAGVVIWSLRRRYEDNKRKLG